MMNPTTIRKQDTITSLPKVSIITVNWNKPENTAEWLRSVKELNYPNYNVIVVDNASTDGSTKFLTQKFPEVTYIQNDANKGWTGGCNEGMTLAMKNGVDYVLISNNDIIFDRNCLARLIYAAESSPNIAFAGPKIYYYNHRQKLFSGGSDFNYVFLTARIPPKLKQNVLHMENADENRDVNWIEDAVLLIRKEAIEDVGMFDEDYFMYVEEVDWCYRVRRAGYKILFVPKAVAWHKGQASSGGNSNSFIAYYKARNRILFTRKNLPIYYLIALIPGLMAFMLVHILKSPRIGVISAILKGISWHFNHIRLAKSHTMIS